MASGALSHFLGTKRWAGLFRALKEETDRPATPPVSTGNIFVALLFATVPVAITILDGYRSGGAESSSLPTIAFGVCAILAFLGRNRLHLPCAFSNASWRRVMELTHIGVALGCIPAVIVFCFNRNLLIERHDTLAAYVPPNHHETREQMSLLGRMAMILAMSAWVAVTEEVIFRGFLVSAIRRWSFIRSQRTKDILSVVVSSAIFGAAHFATWGPYAAVALTGLGVGFVIGYIANGERLLPLILYHMLFDVLSLVVATS